MKHLAKLLLAALVLTQLAACGETAPEKVETESTDVSSVTETETEETMIPDSLPDMNLDGFSYRMLVNGTEDRVAETWAEELNGNLINDAVHNKIVTVEERFNTDISWVTNNENDTVDVARKIISAGDDAFDMIQGHDISMCKLSLDGMFYNAYDIPYLDFSKPWWPESTLESMTIAGQMYMMFNNISYNNLASTRIMFFNKEMMTDLGLEYPYNMVYEGTWTMDSMLEMVELAYEDTNGSGGKDMYDTFGYVSDTTFYGYMEPFQIEPYKKDDDGNLYYEFDLERMMTLTEKTYNMIFGVGGFMNKDTGRSTNDFFSNGRSLFRFTEFRAAIADFSYSDVVYGALPMPKLDETQEDYHGGSTDRPIAIPITIANPEYVGIVTEALNVEGYRQVFPAYYEIAMKNRYADQSDDAQMIELIHDNVIISFTYLHGDFRSAYNIMLEELLGGSTPSTDVASWAAKYEKSQILRVQTLQKFYDKNRD